jgi:hypothetical protein
MAAPADATAVATTALAPPSDQSNLYVLSGKAYIG